jgi:hypothetical protein
VQGHNKLYCSEVNGRNMSGMLLVSGFLSFMESRPVKMGPTRCPERSVNNYLTTPCNHPKDHRLVYTQIFTDGTFEAIYGEIYQCQKTKH